jgi:glycosyltransferase involved in cell wall biosynthesis
MRVRLPVLKISSPFFWLVLIDLDLSFMYKPLTTYKIHLAVLAVYTHIEGYPPSLNALQCLSAKFKNIVVVHRNVLNTNWRYPPNVELKAASGFTHYSTLASKPIWWKLIDFFKYTLLFRQQIKINCPSWVILHDPFAMLAWFIVRNTLSRNYNPKIWYHNHDVILGNESFLARWAFLAQNRIFSSLDKFSLPTMERISFFPIEQLKFKPCIIPNYPSKSFFGKSYVLPQVDSTMRLIFQGHISIDNGLELIIRILSCNIEGKQLELHLAGHIDTEYENRLIQLADGLGVKNRLFIHGRLPYLRLPALTSSCHIGLALYGDQNLMVKTMGTASNKIYEYAALGLPVILYDNIQFKKYLGEYPWAFFSGISMDSLKSKIADIISSYNVVSKAARFSFESDLNFEKCFEKAIYDL